MVDTLVNTELADALESFPEPVFVNLSRSLGIDSQPGGPVRQPYMSYRSAMLHRQVKSNPRNRFLVSSKVYKYGLCSCFISWQDKAGHEKTGIRSQCYHGIFILACIQEFPAGMIRFVTGEGGF